MAMKIQVLLCCDAA